VTTPFQFRLFNNTVADSMCVVFRASVRAVQTDEADNKVSASVFVIRAMTVYFLVLAFVSDFEAFRILRLYILTSSVVRALPRGRPSLFTFLFADIF